MSVALIIQTVIELAAIIFLMIGVVKEDVLIKFEENVRRIVVGNYRRLKRQRRAKKADSKEGKGAA